MKTKYFFVYVFVGIAFLAVSLWVWLSGGRNARAVNAKYRLGGVMLTAWSFLSMVSCDIPGQLPLPGGDNWDDGLIMCYDPVMPEEDYSLIEIRHADQSRNFEANEIVPGDTIVVRIIKPANTEYTLEVTSMASEENPEVMVLQHTDFTVEQADDVSAEILLSEDITFKGQGAIWVESQIGGYRSVIIL